MFYSLATRPARSFQRSDAPVARNSALDKFLDETLTSLAGADASNVDDYEKTYSLQLDVPGLSRDQLEIGIEGDLVCIASKADAGRSVNSAWRFLLEIDVSSSSARLENDVLTLTLGKKIPVGNVTQLKIQ